MQIHLEVRATIAQWMQNDGVTPFTHVYLAVRVCKWRAYVERCRPQWPVAGASWTKGAGVTK